LDIDVAMSLEFVCFHEEGGYWGVVGDLLEVYPDPTHHPFIGLA
jgi:hypothetical protein